MYENYKIKKLSVIDFSLTIFIGIDGLFTTYSFVPLWTRQQLNLKTETVDSFSLDYYLSTLVFYGMVFVCALSNESKKQKEAYLNSPLIKSNYFVIMP